MAGQQQITQIVPVSKTKCRVFIDGETSFVLYKRECNVYGIEEGKEFTSEMYSGIFELLKKRALNYAVYLLEASDRTEGQIRDKLYKGGYPSDVADYVINKLSSHRYVNDKNYAENFVRKNCSTMSIREIENKLYEKKVPEKVIKEAVGIYKNDNDCADRDAFLYLLDKKKIDVAALNIKEKQKLAAYFLRKGFSYEMVRTYLSVNDEENY